MFPEIPKNCRYGYARVSSKSQEDNSSLESQKEELRVPEKNIYTEAGSAADPIPERPVFQKLIDQELQENDLLLVTKIDRCSRNTLEFLKLQERLFKKSVRFIALDLPYSNDMAVNKLIAEVQDLKEKKNLSITQIAKVTGRGRTTIYKILKEELNYVPYNRLVKQGDQNDPK